MTTIHLSQPVLAPKGSVSHQQSDGSWVISAPTGHRIALEVVAATGHLPGEESGLQLTDTRPCDRTRRLVGSLTVADTHGRATTVVTESRLVDDPVSG